MNPHSIATLTGAIALSLATAALAAPPPDKGKSDKTAKAKAPAHGEAARDGELVRAQISAATARQIAISAGLAGGKALPPGVRKNLARGKPLPPGIAKSRLPGDMIGQLPVYRGYDWQMAGCDLVLVNSATRVVADVLRDVFR